MPSYVVKANALRSLGAGDALRLQGMAVAMRVKYSPPGEDEGVIETSLPADDAERVLQDMKNRGEIADFREEITGFVPLGTIYPLGAEGTIRKHFPTVGVPEDTLIEGTLGVADTGVPPQAAKDGPLSEYNISSVDGGQDTVGHGTAVTSCSFIRNVVHAQALPGGSGSESTIAQAIHRLADHGVDAINLSLGFPGLNPPRSSIIDAAVAYAQGRGIPCSAAMGNSGWSAKIGSPQAVCAYTWGATVLDGSAPASFTTGGCNIPTETAALPGQQVGVAHLDGGYGLADGTSFSAPLGTSIIIALVKQDWNPGPYCDQHSQPFAVPRASGLLVVDDPSDIGYGSAPVADEVWRENANGIADEVWRITDEAQRTGWESDATKSALGAIKDYMDQMKHWIAQAPKADGEPEPKPEFVSPVQDGGPYGGTKWLPGSSGCDIFHARGTSVVAPADATVKLVKLGTGLGGGAEMILATDNNAWAWRYRHVQAKPGLTVGTRVSQGQVVAMVYDDSLALLGSPPAWSQPMPDQYQHLDLSVNQGTDQFHPQGGGGGNVDADVWLESTGYQGRKLARTPGPTDAGTHELSQYLQNKRDEKLNAAVRQVLRPTEHQS